MCARNIAIDEFLLKERSDEIPSKADALRKCLAYDTVHILFDDSRYLGLKVA